MQLREIKEIEINGINKRIDDLKDNTIVQVQQNTENELRRNK